MRLDTKICTHRENRQHAPRAMGMSGSCVAMGSYNPDGALHAMAEPLNPRCHESLGFSAADEQPSTSVQRAADQ